MPKKGYTTVIIPAAGTGSRLKSRTPKQFLRLGRKPILVHTLERFQLHPAIDEIIVVTSPENFRLIASWRARYRIFKLIALVEGGISRQESVRNALRLVNGKKHDLILVHDAVRPFVSRSVISQVVESARSGGAAVPAVPPKDTIRTKGSKGKYGRTIERSSLFLIQTPQAFRLSVLRKANQVSEKVLHAASDDAVLVERIGTQAKIVMGSYDNIKITTVEDLDMAKIIGKRWEL